MKTELLRSATTQQTIPSKPWHRLAVRLHIEGWTMQDIATELSQPVADITAVITSDASRGEIAAAIERDEGVVERILAAAGLDSVYTLITLRDGAKVEGVRYQAAKTLLEQGHGKPLAKVKQIIEDNTQDPIEEATRLKAELGITKAS